MTDLPQIRAWVLNHTVLVHDVEDPVAEWALQGPIQVGPDGRLRGRVTIDWCGSVRGGSVRGGSVRGGSTLYALALTQVSRPIAYYRVAGEQAQELEFAMRHATAANRYSLWCRLVRNFLAAHRPEKRVRLPDEKWDF